jgi:hypothetical protein
MKILLRIIFIIVLAGLFKATLAQTNFKPGYIITLRNDTIHGFLDSRNDIRHSQVCTFKPIRKAPIEKYEPGQINGYRFENGKFYVSRSINYKNERKQIFLEYIVNGIADLYYYKDSNGQHFLIEKEDGKIYELTNDQKQVYIDGKAYLKKTNRYIGILKATFNDAFELHPEIENSRITHKSLTKILKNYHEIVCDDDACIIYEKKLPPVRVFTTPYISLNYSSLNFENHSRYSSYNFNNDVYPGIGLASSLFLPRLNERISLDGELEFSRIYFYSFNNELYGSSSKDINETHIGSNLLRGGFSVKYNYPKGRIRPVLSGGISAIYFIKPEFRRHNEIVFNNVVHVSEFNDVPAPNMLLSPVINLGVNYLLPQRKNLSIRIRYERNIDTSKFKMPDLYNESGALRLRTIGIAGGISF